MSRQSITRFFGALTFAAAAAAAGEASAQTNVMFIFDASGSMKRSAGSETRIVAAKRAFSETLAAIPGGVRTGLIAYGHRKAKDCSDIEVVSPIGADQPTAQARMVQGFEAIGETPIAAAIERAGQTMSAFRGQSNSIVLITDGIEECRGDPCAAAAALGKLGIDVKVHVVGFALGAGESSKLQCVVEQTGGRYFDASDVTALRRTLAEVREIVVAQAARAVEPPPVPATRASKVVFEDKFDGKDLSGEQSEMLNRNADRYIVEKGELMMVNPSAVGLNHKGGVNILRLKDELPDGDWDIVVDAKLQFQTLSDGFDVGLMTDEKNFLSVSATWTGADSCNKIELRINRMASGEETRGAKTFSGSGCGLGAFGNEDTKSIVKAMETNGVRIVLMKRDRKYSGTFEIKDWTDAKKNSRKITTDELTSLRIPGRLALHVGKLDPKARSETGVRIDQIQILAYQ
jgi:Ca-activated chloride channel homolog